MKTTTVSELKNHLSRYLAYVRRGGKIRVLDRNVPVAELGPPVWTADATEAKIRALECSGILRCGPQFGRDLPASWYARGRPGKKAGVLAALLEERSLDR